MENYDNLFKALPPKIAYRLRQWFKKFQPQLSSMNLKQRQRAKQVIAQKIEEMMAVQDLKKNEIMTSLYKNGDIKMIFGSEINPKIKKMAIDWCKKKGLNPVEVSLNKSSDSNEEYLFSSNLQEDPLNICFKRFIQAF